MKFDKLRQKLGMINPETLTDVLDGKIKLSHEEREEFNEYMDMGRRMFAKKKS
jgi:hypothetical protein|tara:strand:- start:1114 stop:1272 length:159 start_codon:yes stop_codon:yes gene_type:complete